MYDRPDPLQLLAMVRDLLRDTVIPKLDPATAYHVRVASNVLAIVGRQIEYGPASDNAERERLQQLLASAETDLHALNDQLAAAVRVGALRFDDPAVAAHLWTTTCAKLAVDQPTYPRYVEAMAK